MQPTVGRLVRYVLAEGDLPAASQAHVGRVITALVVEVHNDNVVTLSGFPNYKALGTLPMLALLERRHAYPPTPGHWHWPPELHARQAIEQARASDREKQTPDTRSHKAPKRRNPVTDATNV